MDEEIPLSIGEVLTRVQERFPDVTISKIRFLESQGLIAPERSPSGYRKFSTADVEALEWVLEQQRDSFLPLKVIRERLERGDHLAGDTGTAQAVPGPTPTDTTPQPDVGSPAEEALGEAPTGEDTSRDAAGEAPAGTPGDVRGAVPVPQLFRRGVLDGEPTAVTMSTEELVNASGLSAEDLDELETFGLLESTSVGSVRHYDGEALLVARTARAFGKFGIEPRHLRMFLIAADRQAAVYEQAVLALSQQDTAAARAERRESLETLASLGERLQAAMLRRSLRELLD